MDTQHLGRSMIYEPTTESSNETKQLPITAYTERWSSAAIAAHLAGQVELLPERRPKLAHALLQVQVPQHRQLGAQRRGALHQHEVALHHGAHARVTDLDCHHRPSRLARLRRPPL